MLRHLMKLVWNRKKTNLLIMLEVLCSFLVVFAIVATGLNLLNRYRQPLGYDYRDVWVIDVAMETSRWGAWSPEAAETFRRLLRELDQVPAVVRAAAGTNAPFSNSSSVTGWKYEGRDMGSEAAWVTESYADVLRIPVIHGRWFNEEDRAMAWRPVVIDQRLATELYGDEDPLGMRLEDPGEEDEAEQRVVGVIETFRRKGEFGEIRSFMFGPAREYDDDGASLNRILIRVAPGTGADFEEELTRRLQSIARAWTFTVTPLETQRESQLRGTLLPLLVMGTVGGFLLLMVVLGLTGVMWQNVTRRTKEMGLRRAAGASRASIHKQIVAEVMVTAGFGVAVGVLLAVQAPLIGFGFATFDVVLAALVVSAAFMLILAAACGLYPGWTATRIQPAEALHYE